MGVVHLQVEEEVVASPGEVEHHLEGVGEGAYQLEEGEEAYLQEVEGHGLHEAEEEVPLFLGVVVEGAFSCLVGQGESQGVEPFAPFEEEGEGVGQEEVP